MAVSAGCRADLALPDIPNRYALPLFILAFC